MGRGFQLNDLLAYFITQVLFLHQYKPMTNRVNSLVTLADIVRQMLGSQVSQQTIKELKERFAFLYFWILVHFHFQFQNQGTV